MIAIIGILSSVVLASLGTARDKARIASIRAEASGAVADLLIDCDGHEGDTGTTATFSGTAITVNGTCSTFATGIKASTTAGYGGLCSVITVSEDGATTTCP